MGPFVGCYSFTCVVQWELFLHSHLFWFFPCSKPDRAPRCFLPSSLGQKHNCFFTEIPACEKCQRRAARTKRVIYSLFDLINLIDLLPSSQSQLNDNLTESVEELQPPCCWQLHRQSQPAPQRKGAVLLSTRHLLSLQNQVKLATSQTQNLIPDSATACHNTSFHSEMKMPYLPYMALHALLKVNKIELVTPGWEFPCKCTVGCNQSPLLISSLAVWTTREKKIQKAPWKLQASTNKFQFLRGNSLHYSLVSIPISGIKIRHEWQNQNLRACFFQRSLFN